jgi:hypothetical protein
MASFNYNSNSADAVFYGANEVDAIYQGVTQVYISGTFLSLTFYESALGATMGSTDAYVVDTSGNIIGTAVYSRAAANNGNANWNLRTATAVKISVAFRIAWHYVSGSSFTGDYAIDTVTLQGTPYNFDAGSSDAFLTNSVETPNSATAFSSAVTPPTNSSQGRWSRQTGSTGSNSTGPATAQSGTHYLYTETSGSAGSPSKNFWLFSPEIVL